MNNSIQIITGIIETGVISFVVYMIIKGLKTQIGTLENQISTQNQTILTMDKRIQETEKIGDLYKQLVSDFPQALDDYQQVITKTKDSTIVELKSRVEQQDLTISDLTEQTNNSDPKIVQKASEISKLFLDKTNKSLLEFLQKIEEKPETMIDAMLHSKGFSDLLNKLEIQTEILEDTSNIRDLFGDDYMKKYNAKTASFGVTGGIYIISFDKKLYITEKWLQDFTEKYNLLK